jgi:hypothetical protein
MSDSHKSIAFSSWMPFDQASGGHNLRGSSPIRPSAEGYLALPLVSFVLISDLSYNTTFNKELWISSFPLYLI